MIRRIPAGVFGILAILLLICGCMEAPPIKEPSIAVSTITLSDLSLSSMTVNATVLVTNPNPIGGRLNRVDFDLFYIDDTRHHLGHGEQTDIDIKADDTTAVTIPVTLDNVHSLQALASFAKRGSLLLEVNGSAFVDIRVMSYERPFVRNATFYTRDFTSFLPQTPALPESMNITEGLHKLDGFLTSVAP